MNSLQRTTKPSPRSLLTHEGRKIYDPIIDQLIEARKAKGLTQVEVDVRIGCADRLVSKWESRNRYPSAYFLLIWCQVLGVSLKIDPDSL
jgi:transcriptional regulator with XRE-family HTH domain